MVENRAERMQQELDALNKQKKEKEEPNELFGRCSGTGREDVPNGVEVAAKLSGKAAERLAVLLYAVLKEQKKTKGKVRLTNMLKSGKELKVFAVRTPSFKNFVRKQRNMVFCTVCLKTEMPMTD
jgi:hypothetical protein